MKLHSRKIAVIVSILLILCFTAAISYAASSKEITFSLLPQETDDMLGTLIAHEPNAVPATAEADIPDLLVPDEEAPKETAYTIPDNTEPLKILLYHTHATEAYRQDGEDTYEPSGDYRTNDNTRNIVAIGEVMKNELEKLGFQVIHDTTNNEPPKLSTAYSRSLVTMEKYSDDNIDIYIDIHRDASNAENTDDVVVINGERCARMMFVVGTGVRKDGTEYDPKPNFEQTYAFADAITKNINENHENFMREIRVKNGRYNQHLSDHSLLIEVGHNINTLQEAKNSVKYFAKALYDTVQ